MFTSGQTIVILFCCNLVIRSAAARASVPTASDQCDGYELFYDHGTEMCELCSEICLYAKIQGTEEQCQNNCPQYLRALDCRQAEGLYYDEVSDHCESCCKLCNKGPAPNPRCVQKCPDFSIQADPTNQAPNAAAGSDDTMKLPPCVSNGSSGKKSSSSDDVAAHPVWVSIIIVAAVTISIVIILVACIVIRNSRSKPYAAVFEQDVHYDARVNSTYRERNRAEVQPVEETRISEAQGVTFMTDEGGTMTITIPAKMAFADLSIGHGASTQCVYV